MRTLLLPALALDGLLQSAGAFIAARARADRRYASARRRGGLFAFICAAVQPVVQLEFERGAQRLCVGAFQVDAARVLELRSQLEVGALRDGRSELALLRFDPPGPAPMTTVQLFRTWRFGGRPSFGSWASRQFDGAAPRRCAVAQGTIYTYYSFAGLVRASSRRPQACSRSSIGWAKRDRGYGSEASPAIRIIQTSWLDFSQMCERTSTPFQLADNALAAAETRRSGASAAAGATGPDLMPPLRHQTALPQGTDKRGLLGLRGPA